MKRPPGSGPLYERWGSYYGRWRTPDGRRLNRKLGPIRTKGGSDGLTRAQAEQAFRRIQAEEASREPVDPVVETLTVDQVADRLRQRIAIEGARKSYRQSCESMQRVHISPALGKRQQARAAGIARSIGSRGDWFDNAVAESFFATLKKELIHRCAWPTRAELRTRHGTHTRSRPAPHARQ